MKRALITGITGQDGSYLAELLLKKGYEVHGIVRPGATLRTQNIAHLLDPERLVQIHYADLIDSPSLLRVLEATAPDEIYHLGAQAHVRISFDMPVYTAEVTALGTLRMLEAMRSLDLRARFYQASSSELYGGKPGQINEATEFHPRSPYACAKAFAYRTAVNYREAYGMFAVNGILFNHESPRRAQHYVTRKVTLSVARIAAGAQKELRLGNLDAYRDWGYAPEYVEGMWRMLQADEPDDYILATGESHSVRELVELAFDRASLDWKKYVKFDERFLRPSEVDRLQGDAAKANEVLGWSSNTSFKDLIELMVESDMRAQGFWGGT
ncbi:MAG: GDP-mannose 4,6-dehydratase [Gammaproteobacteria bacterium]|nr:GDP-mannose 4,6-dehydratase [Gammaproteobacteria bacterium]